MRCQRQTNFTLEGRKVYGRDATMDEIRKLSDYFGPEHCAMFRSVGLDFSQLIEY